MRSDGNPGQTGDRENPNYVRDILCPLSRVELDPRNPSWPAVFNPHQQAGHKTAPDRDAKLQKVLAMQEPSTQDIRTASKLPYSRNEKVRSNLPSIFRSWHKRNGGDPASPPLPFHPQQLVAPDLPSRSRACNESMVVEPSQLVLQSHSSRLPQPSKAPFFWAT